MKKRYPSGRFEGRVLHKQDGLHFAFTPESFRFFHREKSIPGLLQCRELGRYPAIGELDEVKGDYWWGFYILTRARFSPNTVGVVFRGMESRASQMLQYRLSKDTEMELDSDEYVSGLLEMLNEDPVSLLSSTLCDYVTHYGLGDHVLLGRSVIRPRRDYDQ